KALSHLRNFVQFSKDYLALEATNSVYLGEQPLSTKSFKRLAAALITPATTLISYQPSHRLSTQFENFFCQCPPLKLW
ncbi:hypothetical protein, partial [Lacticaseibacillus camelliae]|uniref:hypothetical protein n=1 Tax=Lacticaseibacillus camelliae TaxID=381742 RepID=UPI001F35D343